MKKIAVILNTNKLGGAERSLVEQFSILENKDSLNFFYPKLNSSEEYLTQFLNEKGFNKIRSFNYPSYIYKLSREDIWQAVMAFLKLPSLLIFAVGWIKIFKEFEIFYVNGNKAIFPVLVYSVISNKKVSIYWHFRDYPSERWSRYIAKLLSVFESNFCYFEIITNSYDVEEKARKYFNKYKIRTIYNFAGDLSISKPKRKLSRIGIVAMFAPWKGIHDVIVMAALYEKELAQVGIDEIRIYGDAIYQTSGSHNGYKEQMVKLVNKLGVKTIKFVGLKDPNQIFSEIDLLVHASTSPEPFGRVILEAFKSGTPVISTALGGAAELVIDLETGLRYVPSDAASLYRCICNIIDNPNQVKLILEKASRHTLVLESNSTKQLQDLFN